MQTAHSLHASLCNILWSCHIAIQSLTLSSSYFLPFPTRFSRRFYKIGEICMVTCTDGHAWQFAWLERAISHQVDNRYVMHKGILINIDSHRLYGLIRSSPSYHYDLVSVIDPTKIVVGSCFQRWCKYFCSLVQRYEDEPCGRESITVFVFTVRTHSLNLYIHSYEKISMPRILSMTTLYSAYNFHPLINKESLGRVEMWPCS